MEIVIDPAVCSGKPHIKNTRILVKNILGMLAGGYSVERILKEYPELSIESISATLNYAREVIDEEKIIISEVM